MSGRRRIRVCHDSLERESRSYPWVPSSQPEWVTTMGLAIQSLGVVYGDIGTSPLYVFASTFPGGIKHNDDVLGVLSIIIHTLTLIPLLKYLFIVLKAARAGGGDGGAFALYSLICSHAKVGLIPSEDDKEPSRRLGRAFMSRESKRMRRALMIRAKLENCHFAKLFLLFTAMLSISMVIAQSVLTPCFSVLSAVGGIKQQAATSITDDGVVRMSVAILVCIFMVQRFGTEKLGYSFAPIICVWFAFIGGIGIYNLIKYDPTVLKSVKSSLHYTIFHKKQERCLDFSWWHCALHCRN